MMLVPAESEAIAEKAALSSIAKHVLIDRLVAQALRPLNAVRGDMGKVRRVIASGRSMRETGEAAWRRCFKRRVRTRAFSAAKRSGCAGRAACGVPLRARTVACRGEGATRRR
jgi:hypothetical protein